MTEVMAGVEEAVMLAFIDCGNIVKDEKRKDFNPDEGVKFAKALSEISKFQPGVTNDAPFEFEVEETEDLSQARITYISEGVRETVIAKLRPEHGFVREIKSPKSPEYHSMLSGTEKPVFNLIETSEEISPQSAWFFYKNVLTEHFEKGYFIGGRPEKSKPQF